MTLLCNSVLAGLVAITAGCDIVTDYGAFLIGMFASFTYLGSSKLLSKYKIDDPIDAFPVHGACGALGVILTGFFDKDNGVFYGGSGRYLGYQIAGVICIAAWASVFMFLGSITLKRLDLLRISKDEE